MNLLEALKSGRRFKRPNWDRWLNDYKVGELFQYSHSREDLLVNILGEDYEIESEEYTVTFTQQSIERLIDRHTAFQDGTLLIDSFIQALIKFNGDKIS